MTKKPARTRLVDVQSRAEELDDTELAGVSGGLRPCPGGGGTQWTWTFPYGDPDGLMEIDDE